MRSRNTLRQRVKVADSLERSYSPGLRCIHFEQPDCHRGEDDRRQRTGNTLGDIRHTDTYQKREKAYAECPPVGVKMVGVIDPFVDEVRRYVGQTETEEIVHLGGENRDGYTRCESDNNRIGDELDDRAEVEQTHNNEDDTCHNRGDSQSGKTILLDDAVDDDNKSAGGTAYLHFAAAKKRDDESGDDGRDKSFSGADSGRDTEGDGKRDSYDTDDDAGESVLGKLRACVVRERAK